MQRKHTAETLLTYMGRNWPEAVTPTSKLMMRVYRLAEIVRDNAQQQTSRSGLTFTEFEVLVALRSAAPPHELIPTDLYQAILISSGGLTKVLLGLEKRGLIMRGRGEIDKRSKPVRLTASGKVTVERAMADVLASDGELLAAGLTAAKMERLTKLVAKLLQALEPGGKRSHRIPAHAKP